MAETIYFKQNKTMQFVTVSTSYCLVLYCNMLPIVVIVLDNAKTGVFLNFYYVYLPSTCANNKFYFNTPIFKPSEFSYFIFHIILLSILYFRTYINNC